MITTIMQIEEGLTLIELVGFFLYLANMVGFC